VSELDPRALATLDDVIAYGYDPNDDTGLVDLWLDCINAASDEFYAVGNREFVSRSATRDEANDDLVVVPTETREFDVDEWIVEERRLPVGDLLPKANPPHVDAIRISQLDGTLVETVDLATLIYLPRRREPWQPIGELWFRPSMARSAGLYSGYVVAIDAKWGWPRIPANLRRACANQAALWFERDVKQFTTTFNMDSNRFEVVRGPLADAVRKTVTRYREIPL
jgi:hypothetical protein